MPEILERAAGQLRPRRSFVTPAYFPRFRLLPSPIRRTSRAVAVSMDAIVPRVALRVAARSDAAAASSSALSSILAEADESDSRVQRASLGEPQCLSSAATNNTAGPHPHEPRCSLPRWTPPAAAASFSPPQLRPAAGFS
ncbi:hypothetical protein AAVH_07983 [Aphelenchoides avenae]|nr:hypothetical protein AAVH_07983 [Aphelenchus avenae]